MKKILLITFLCMSTNVYANTLVDDRYPHTERGYIQQNVSSKIANGCGPRPARWCGWWLHQRKGCQYGIGPNKASWWGSWGRPSAPQVNAVAVVRRGRHVGIVTAVHGTTITLLSGNFSGGVGEGIFPIKGTIFRIE